METRFTKKCEREFLCEVMNVTNRFTLHEQGLLSEHSERTQIKRKMKDEDFRSFPDSLQECKRIGEVLYNIQ